MAQMSNLSVSLTESIQFKLKNISKFEDALNILGDKNPTHLITPSSKARRKLLHTLGNSRNGVHRLGKVGAKPDRIERSEEREREMFQTSNTREYVLRFPFSSKGSTS